MPSKMNFIILSLLLCIWQIPDEIGADNSTADSSSKMVTILYPQSQNFYAGTGNLNKIVNIVFGTELDKQSPSCVVDQDSGNSSISGQVSSAFVIFCDLSPLSSVSVGQHKLWVIRSPELRQSTYQLQNPIQLTILPDPASPSTSQWNLTLNPVAAKFANSVDQIQLEMASNLTNIDLGKMVNKSKLDLECQQMLEQTMVAKLGNSPNCSILFDGTNFTGQIALGENATLGVGARISFYLIKFTGANGDNSFQISPTNQTAKTILSIGNATNPSIPIISLQTTAKRIDICASNAITIQINASAANATKIPPLICKWNVKIPNIEAANLAKLTSSVNACSIAFSSKNVANSLSNLSYVSAPVGLEMSVSACNLVGLCSVIQKIILPMDSARKLEATILSLPSRIIASARILLNSKVVYSECGADKFGPNISFIWSINGSLASNSSVFTIAPYTYAPGMVVPVKLTVKHESGMETSDSGTINFELEPIVSIVDATLRTISDGSSCQLDASASWSPNVRDWPLQHNWQCLNLTDAWNESSGQECQLGDLQQQQMANNNGYLVLSGGKLRENGSFLFIDKINDSANATGQLEVRVKVLSANAPTVKLVEDGQNSMPLGFLHIKGLVRNPIGIGGMLMLKWTLFEGKGNQTIDLDKFLKFDSVKNLSMAANAGQTIILQISLPINKMDDFPEWPGLNPDQDYFLRLSANNGKGPSAFAQYQFRIHSLPNIDKLTVTPDSIASLDTLVRIQPSGQFDESEESIFRIRFGIRYLMADNESNRDVWSKGSVQSKLDGVYYETMLPTAWPQPHASCGQRIGYQALFEICDRIWGRCAQFVSDNFTVGQFSMETIGRAVYLLEKRLDNGDVFGALELLDAVNQELCGQWRNTQLLNEILDSLIDQIENSTDSEELLESLDFGIRMAEAASSSNIQKIVFLLNQTKIALNGGDGVQSRRVKRDSGQQIAQGTKTSISSVPSSSSISAPKKISESTANILLVSYDLLLGKDQNVVTVYLSNIGDILASFCTQISQTSMQAYGKSYTSVQAQGIEPGQSGFSNQTFALGGNQTKILTFGPIFTSMFSNWLCGADGTQICTQICLASAITVLQAVRDNEYLRQQFFMPQYAMLSVDQAVSNLYHIYLLDPTTGSNVSLSSQGSTPFSVAVNVSIESYQPSAYYRCFFYNGAQWNDSACTSANSAKMVSPGQFQLQCICHRLGGILGVFNVNPPIPPPYPSHSEIQLNFTLNASQISSSAQMSQFFDQLSKATGILSRRFVSLNSSLPVNSSFVMISAKLRPPFSSDQLTNSYAMQALKRTISCDGGFTAYDNVIVLNMTDSIVKRAMVGDGNARRIPLRIDRSFKDVIGQNTNDTSSIAFRWLSSMGRNMRISEFRFKNPAILMGILFNFTITLPFDGESAAYDETPLSSEEISILIQEMTFYGELDLRDQRDQLLPVDPLSFAEIVELIVLNKTNPMTYWLGGIVGLFITLSTLLIGALVFLKIRCDRLIEQHNENMRTIDLCRTAPINVLPMNRAEQIGGPNQGPSTSTDTVVFGGQGRRRAGRGQTKIDG